MKVRITILILLGMMVTACSSTGGAEMPTEATKPTSTSKPAVTATPTPAPTDTSEPIPTLPPPRPTPQTGDILRTGAYETLLKMGSMFLDEWFFLAAEEVYSGMLEYELDDIQKAEVLSRRAFIYDVIGDFDAAIQDYTESVELDPSNPNNLYSLCWDYAITNQAEQGLPHCEEAVGRESKPYFLDARGITYTLLGRFKDALNDFEVVIAYLEDSTDEYSNSVLESRSDWVGTLEAGDNPFTAEVLADLQYENTMWVDEAPVYMPEEVDFSRASFREKFEAYNFSFQDIQTKNGEEVQIGTFKDGECSEGVKLIGSEDELSSVSLTLTGCRDDYAHGEAIWFMTLFFTEGDDVVDAPWFGKVFA